MRKVLLGSILAVFMRVAVTAGAPKRSPLVPPAQSTRESREHDIHDCISQARADVSFGKPPLDEKAKEPLKGHRTEGFVREGLPVVDIDRVPTISRSLFVGSGLYGPANLSDRYVLCLLDRGYQWR